MCDHRILLQAVCRNVLIFQIPNSPEREGNTLRRFREQHGRDCGWKKSGDPTQNGCFGIRMHTDWTNRTGAV